MADVFGCDVGSCVSFARPDLCWSPDSWCRAEPPETSRYAVTKYVLSPAVIFEGTKMEIADQSHPDHLNRAVGDWRSETKYVLSTKEQVSRVRSEFRPTRVSLITEWRLSGGAAGDQPRVDHQPTRVSGGNLWGNRKWKSPTRV